MPGHYDDCACETCYPKVKTTSAKFVDRILTLVDVNKTLLKPGVFEAVCLEIEEAGREAIKEFADGRMTYTSHDFAREKEIEYLAKKEARIEGFNLARNQAAEIAEYHSGPSIQLAQKIRAMETPK